MCQPSPRKPLTESQQLAWEAFAFDPPIAVFDSPMLRSSERATENSDERKDRAKSKAYAILRDLMRSASGTPLPVQVRC